MARIPAAGRQRRKPQELVRQELLEAAVNVVGIEGYLSSTIAKITSAAGVAHGTFYNYFESQQELFDELLPHLGKLLLRQITEAIGGERDFWVREEIGFRTFFRFVQTYPQFYRVLNEAEIFAERGYRQHIANMVGGYIRAVRRGIADGVLRPLGDQETEAVVLILLAARNYLCMRYALTGPLPDFITATYMELVRGGLASGASAMAVPSTVLRDDHKPSRQPGAIWNVGRLGGADEARIVVTGAVASGFAASNLMEATSAFAEFSRMAVALITEAPDATVEVVGLSATMAGNAASAFSPIRAEIVPVGSDAWTLQIAVADLGGATAAFGTSMVRITG